MFLLVPLFYSSPVPKYNDKKEQPGLQQTSAVPDCHHVASRDVFPYGNRKNDLILIMTPEKQDKTLELSKHLSADSTPARNEVIMKTTYPVKSVKCDKICSNY